MKYGLSNGMLGDLNKCFLELYSRFEDAEDPIRVDPNQSEEGGKFCIWSYGTMGFARIRETLVAADLLCKDQEKFTRDGKTRTRMLVRSTPAGFTAYHNGGLLITVPHPMEQPREIQVGIGELYANIDVLRNLYHAIIEQSSRRVPKYRREDWDGEFWQMIPELAGMLHGEAEVQVRRWINLRLQDCKMRKGFRKYDEYGESVRLSDETLDRWTGSSK